MTTFTCNLAELNIEINAIFPQTRDFCADYLTDDPAAFAITISEEDIARERKMSDQESLKEHGRIIAYPDHYLETLAVYRKIAEQIIHHNVLLFHGSAIAVDDQVYLFTAKSGTGKSTHTRLWREHFGDRAFMVNDDKPLIRVTDNGVFVYGTPWDGKHHLSRNIKLPLKAICILERAETNHIEPISMDDMFITAMQQIYLPQKKAEMMTMLSLIEKMLKQVGCYKLGCNMDPEAAIVSYEGMK